MGRITKFLRDTFWVPPVEARAEWGTEHIIHSPSWGFLSDTGSPVTEMDAYGIPAVSNVIRAPAELIASLPMFVYRGTPRQEARESWQWQLLHEQPADGVDSYQFFYDLEISLEATQNAFVHKIHGVGSRRGRLEALEIIDPHRVTVRLDKDTGEKVFDVWVERGVVRRGLTTRDILHVRGFTPNPGSIAGMSLIELHRNTLGSMRAMQTFEGDYFRNSGVPPFWFTGAANETHAKQIIDAHNKAHAGAGNRYKPGALWGQIDVKSVPMSMSDAAYVDNKQVSVEDACRIWNWPKEWVESRDEGQSVDSPSRTAELLKRCVYPRLRRIERAFKADPDLFGSADMFGEFLTAALERADFVTRTRGYKDARQGGWISANEIRELENLPPKEGGDELQQTPVGGAPNPSADSGGAVAEPDNEEPNDDA